MIILSICVGCRDGYFEFLFIQVKSHLLNHFYIVVELLLFSSMIHHYILFIYFNVQQLSYDCHIYSDALVKWQRLFFLWSNTTSYSPTTHPRLSTSSTLLSTTRLWFTTYSVDIVLSITPLSLQSLFTYTLSYAVLLLMVIIILHRIYCNCDTCDFAWITFLLSTYIYTYIFSTIHGVYLVTFYTLLHSILLQRAGRVLYKVYRMNVPFIPSFHTYL